jgi:Zn-dependent protease
MNTLSTVQKFLLWIIPVLFAITLHEVAHGWVAKQCGDKTAFMLGRLTINPLKHIDLVGTILVPAILFFTSGFIFGWAKPVPVTWENLRNPKRDMALVALAGPLANLLMALFWACVARIGMSLGGTGSLITLVLIYMGQAGVLINLVLMVLNLIPIPPLDGSKVLSSFLPRRAAWYMYRIEPYGLIILAILLVSGILSKLILPPLLMLYTAIMTLFGLSS